MKLHYSKRTVIWGAVIYSSGDLVAALILNEFSWLRLIGMMFIGATFYAFEIPNFFTWIEKSVRTFQDKLKPAARTFMAILYFNPLWIARHLIFIKLFSGHIHELTWNLLTIASWSFIVNIPISFAANYIIQNMIKMKWRFLSSAVFSALMAVYYALSIVFFR